MSVKRNIAILIGIIGILIVLLTASIGYILANNENWTAKKITDKNNKVLNEIKELKSLYDSKIADKTNSYMVLQLQKDSIQNLVSELEDSKENAASLLKYKTQYKNLESKMTVLVDEIYMLKSKKIKVVLKKEALFAENKPKKNNVVFSKNIQNSKKNPKTTKLESSVLKSEIQSETPPKLLVEAPISKIKNNKKLSLSNVKVHAYTSKSASKKVETTIASNTDLIKISFTLNENPEADSEEKTFYFQVINSNNNLMGKRITEYFDNEALTYSFSKSVIYNDQSIQVSHDFIASNFEKGYYFINIFDRDQLVGKTSILLK